MLLCKDLCCGWGTLLGRSTFTSGTTSRVQGAEAERTWTKTTGLASALTAAASAPAPPSCSASSESTLQGWWQLMRRKRAALMEAFFTQLDKDSSHRQIAKHAQRASPAHLIFTRQMPVMSAAGTSLSR